MTIATNESPQFRRGIGLTGKLIIHSLWVLAALATTLTWFSLRAERALLLDELRLRHTAQTNYWIQNNLVNLISPDSSTLASLTRDLQTSGDVAYIVMYDAQGKMMAATGPEADRAMPRAINPQQLSTTDAPFETVTASGGGFYELALPIALPQGPSTGTETSISALSGMPAASGKPARPEALGAVRLGISAASVNDKMMAIRNNSIRLAAAIVVLALLLSYVFMRRNTYPIKEVASQATAIANGDFHQTSGLLKIRSHDEVGELAKNFHSMAVRLKESRDELQRFNRELEQRVMERTAEMQATNRQLEEANRRLMELDELKSNFLSTVSHELRTPLTSIKAFAEILLDNQGEDSETQLRFLEIINNESERLSRLIGDLLDLAKIESGTVAWKMDRLDIRQVIQKSLDGVSSLAAKRGLTVSLNMASDLPGIRGDRDKLVQLVTNLLSNAIKFTNDGGRIDINADVVRRRNGSFIPITMDEASPEDFLKVSVRDSGIGIPQDHLKRIFEKFHQVDNASTRQRGGGTGLGLAICKEIMQHHGGDIWAESELNLGSTFIFVLPVHFEARPAASDRVERTPAAVRAAQPAAGRKKVLVVDDEPHIREFLKYELAGEGYEVLEAANGEDTVAIARREQPSIITLDVLMPGIDGFDILSILNHDPATASIPVILVSVIDDRDKGFHLGAVDYIVKPIDRKEFVDCIQRVSSQLQGTPRRKVLVVDDDRSITEALRKILTAEGYEVFTAYDGESALDQARANSPDLIFLDLKLPGISGYDVMREFKSVEGLKSTPIVVMTASAFGRSKVKSLALGASEYLTKPFSKDKFLETLKGLLAGAKRDA